MFYITTYYKQYNFLQHLIQASLYTMPSLMENLFINNKQYFILINQ